MHIFGPWMHHQLAILMHDVHPHWCLMHGIELYIWCLMHSIEPYWCLMYGERRLSWTNIWEHSVLRILRGGECCSRVQLWAILMPDAQHWAILIPDAYQWAVDAQHWGSCHSTEPYWCMMQIIEANWAIIIDACMIALSHILMSNSIEPCMHSSVHPKNNSKAVPNWQSPGLDHRVQMQTVLQWWV